MAVHSADLNQDALSKLEAEQKFPVVQEQEVEKVKIAKDTIQWQVSLALEMMKAWKTSVIDLSKLPHYADNWPITKEQLELSKISAETFQDISKLSPKAQDEFITIYNEFQRNNPSASLWKDNPYWKNIFEAVKIKNETIWDISELEEWKKEIKKAIDQVWISHWMRWAEAKVYRYFKSKIAFLWKIDNNFKQEVLEGEKEFLESWRKNTSWYYWILSKFTTKKPIWLRIRNMKKLAPNFYTKLSQEVLKDTEHKVFTKDLYDIIKNEAEARKNEAEARKHKERAKMLEKVTNALRKSL